MTQPNCPSTHSYWPGAGFIGRFGLQCQFLEGHDGDHCATFNNGQMSYGVWWENVPKMTPEGMLIQFHETFGYNNDLKLRKRLLKEEAKEFCDAIDDNNMVDLADAIADVCYIAIGTAVNLKMPFNAIFAEVHRSNMTKLPKDGKPIIRDDGKILKPDTFEPPRLAQFLTGNDCDNK